MAGETAAVAPEPLGQRHRIPTHPAPDARTDVQPGSRFQIVNINARLAAGDSDPAGQLVKHRRRAPAIDGLAES